MSPSVLNHWIAATVLICGGSLPTAQAADEMASSQVAIRTIDQRHLTGVIDARTNARHLWIRHESSNTVLSVPVAWTSIASATLDGASVEVAGLAEVAKRQATVGGVDFFAKPAPIAATNQSPPPDANYHGVAPPALHDPQIVNIEIDACLVNLDRDVEPDGVEVAVAALNRYGETRPVRGSFVARLTVERGDFHTGRIQYETAQRWSQAVSRRDFHNGVAVYRLRFRTVRPEQDLELSSLGLLNVRFSVAGQGNFEASTPLSIRPLNPFRDWLQLQRGTRFLRDELAEPVRGRDVKAWTGRPRVWTPYSVIGVSP